MIDIGLFENTGKLNEILGFPESWGYPQSSSIYDCAMTTEISMAASSINCQGLSDMEGFPPNFHGMYII